MSIYRANFFKKNFYRWMLVRSIESHKFDYFDRFLNVCSPKSCKDKSIVAEDYLNERRRKLMKTCLLYFKEGIIESNRT